MRKALFFTFLFLGVGLAHGKEDFSHLKDMAQDIASSPEEGLSSAFDRGSKRSQGITLGSARRRGSVNAAAPLQKAQKPVGIPVGGSGDDEEEEKARNLVEKKIGMSAVAFMVGTLIGTAATNSFIIGGVLGLAAAILSWVTFDSVFTKPAD